MSRCHLRFRVLVVSSLLAATFLAGCSTIERIEEVRDFADRAARVNDQRMRVLGDPILGIDEMPGTVFNAVPATGNATFTGTAFVTLENDNRRTDVFALVGDARVTVDFAMADDAVTGDVTNFRQTRINNTSLFVPGELAFDAGIIGAEEPNDLSFDYAGFVTASGVEFALEGRLEGKLRGTRTDALPGESIVRAISVEDSDAVITGGRLNYSASVVVIAED